MKSRVVIGLFVLFTIAAAAPALAQVQPSIKAGVNFASVNGEFDEDEGDETQMQKRVGAVVGAGVSIPTAHDRVTFDLDFLYSQEGVKLKVGQAGDSDATLRLDYIRIPMLFRIGVGSGTGGYFLVGPSLGIRVNAEYKSDEGGTEDADDAGAGIKKADFGIAVGAGANIRRFFLQGTYMFGLTDLNKNSGDKTFDNRNSVITALVGVRF
jgi:hypothetical protein